MRHAVKRTTLVAAVGCALLAAAAPAWGASPGASMPAGNPVDYAGLAKGGTAKLYQIKITPTMLANPGTTTFGDPETTGGGSVTIGKRSTAGMNGFQTVTVRPLDTGLTLASAMATQAGGNLGTTQIASTALTGARFTVKLKFPGSEGTSATIYLRFTTYQLVMQ